MADLAQFPEFSPVSPELAPRWQETAKRFEPYSDFSLVNLCSWDYADTGRLSSLNGNLVVELDDYVYDQQRFITFLGNNAVAQTIRTLSDYGREQPITTALKLIPEASLTDITGRICTSHTLKDDHDNKDYVLDISQLLKAEGKTYNHLRKSRNQFSEHYGAFTNFQEVDLCETRVQQDIMTLFSESELAKNHPSGYQNEALALNKFFQSRELSQDAAGFALYDQDKMLAFIICELAGNGWSIGHFWKADSRLKGIYSYFLVQIADELNRRDIRLFNIQQDLGISGLRQAKRQYRPVRFLRKFTLGD